MSTKTLLPSSSSPSSLITDRYFFRSHSNDTRMKSDLSKRKYYKFSSTNTEQYPSIYKFPINQNEKRSHSSDTNRYYFSLANTTQRNYLRSNYGHEQRSVTFVDGSSTILSDPPYLFSSQKYPHSISTYPHPEDTWTYQRQRSQKIFETDIDSSLPARSISPEQRRSTRMDTVTSTNGSLSLLKRSPTDKSSLLSPNARSYLNQARKRLSGRKDDQLLESFEKSVDRLILSINKKYGQHSSITTPPTTSTSSSNYISQYYAKEDERSFESDDEQQKFSYNLNINRTHTQIMKTVNKSLIDRSYQIDKSRLKYFEQTIQRYLRLFEQQSLQRELNYDLIRCFSCSYLHDLRQEEFRQNKIRSQMNSYTYEDIQDIYTPSIFEAYKMKLTINREKYQRLQSSISTGQLSPISSSEYSPIMIRSLNENMDTHSRGFETDRKSITSISQISPNIRPNVDVFYEIMQDSFRSIDSSIAGYISKTSKSHRTTTTTTTNIDIKSNSLFWSDDELIDPYQTENSNKKKSIPNQRQISRYLSAVNRSLLDCPSDLITDFYLAQLNRNMQESVRNIELIARDKGYQKEFINKLERSLSAEHLYQVRKEHLRYKQTSIGPTSFTTEDVTDIYKPFVLENYKRKIAIELERRRRERQEQLILNSPVRTSEIDSTHPINKSSNQLQTKNDFSMISPATIVQTKEIIMGRARRTLTHDGSSDVIHHISGVSPPLIYSSDKQLLSSSSRPQKTLRLITTVSPPDFPTQDESHRSQTRIYQTNTIQICRANRIESDSDSLTMVNIEPIQTLNQHNINSLNYQFYDGQITQHIEQKPIPQQSKLIISIDEHIPKMHEDIPITEIIQTTNISIPSSNHAHEVTIDSGISLNISHTNEPPTILNSPYIQINTEPLPEIQGTIISNDILDIYPSNDSVPLASLLEQMTSSMHKQHARQIIDDNYYWKTCEKVEENARIAIIVYDTEWADEYVDEFSSNIQNAQYKYPENISYEYVKINQPYSFTIQPIIDNNEQLTSLTDDSYIIQQSNIHHNNTLNLENPILSKDFLTFNYAHHKENIYYNNSQTSSFLDMETFLNNFEESIDHEQHLPFINQISVSYAASINERNKQINRSLPIEWYQPILSLHDEQLVEQWTMENNLDTIQHEGTLRRQQVDFLTNTECENLILASTTDAFCINERFDEYDKSNNTIVREHNDMISHCSPTSDYETDFVEKDNDTLIVPLTILPSSSITNPTLLSQSSPLLTSYTAPIAPIVYFLDVLALEQKEINNNSTKNFLLTIGFGQDQMNEVTNTVATTDLPLRPTWINRSLSNNNIEILPTSIHYENQLISPLIHHRQIHYAIENQIEEDEIACLIHPYRLQFGYDLGENTQLPLNSFFEPSYLHLPMTNEVFKYHTEFSCFSPADIQPDIVVSKMQDHEIFSPNECQINQPEILAYAQIDYLLDNKEDIEPISIKFDQPIYIEHYHIQSLFPFTERCYTNINQIEILTDDDDNNNNNNNNNHFLSNFILRKPIKNEDEDLLKRFMGQNTDNKQIRSKQPSDLNIIKSKSSSVEVRPPVSPESGPIYEGVKIHQHVDANMGPKGQYEQRANYTYENENDRSSKQTKYSPYERTIDSQQANIIQQDDIYIPEKIIEHISEDEKSTSSEEVFFEEWTEEFRCRRTDEYDGNTNRLVRTTIDETSDRIKGDVIKEQYKEKNTRIKGHKSYDVIKEIHRRAPNYIQEEIPQSPPPFSSIVPRPSSRNRQWTSEDIYTTEIVQDPTIVRELESTAQKFDSLTHYDRVRPSQTPPISSAIQTNITTYPSSPYDRISNVITPSVHYVDTRKKEQQEEVVSEEYHVEFETTTTKQDKISGENQANIYVTTDQQSPTRQTSDWRHKLKQIYNPPSDDDQYKNSTNGNYLAQRVSVIPSNTQQRFKEVQIKLPGHDKTPPERRKFESSPPLRHTVKEVLVCVSRGSSPEKSYHSSVTNENEQKKKKLFFVNSESPKKISSTSPTDDDQPRSPPSIIKEHRTQYEPTFSRVGQLKNTFETTTTTSKTNESTKDDQTKYKTSISTGLTGQRRQLFEDQEWTRRPINERRISETHTVPSLVSDRVSRIENIQSTDQFSRKDFDTSKISTPQTSIDIKFKSKQVISSIDSDISGPTQPIYQSTPKSYKQKQAEDAGHESEDELSDPKQNYDIRRRTSKTRLRDFSQSTSQLIDTTRETSKFNETNLNNVSTSKSTLVELSPSSPTKSHLTSDSGVFDYSTSHQLPTTSSPSWRHNVSTTIIGDNTPTRSHDNGVYIDSTIINSPYGRRQISDTDQTIIQNIDDSTSRSTYKYDRDNIHSNQYPHQQQYRTVRRQLTKSPPTATDYENLTSYQSRIDTHSKIPITTQSRTIKPLVVDEYETVETETQVECQVQRKNEINESTKTERIVSPISPSKKTFITTTTTTHSSDETTPARRVLLNEQPQYYESTKNERQFQPIQHDHSHENLSYRRSPQSHTMKVTSLSPTHQITFGQHSPNEIVAIVRVPELSKSPINESNVYDNSEQDHPRLHYQRVYASSYRPSLLPDNYQQRTSRSRNSPFENANDNSSPINFPIRSASYHTNLHDQNQQQQQQQKQQIYRPQTRYHSSSLGNLFGSNLDFEIEIEKRPPQKPEQPTSVSLDQCSRAVVTTSKDGRVSVQNISARPGNTIVINSDFHSSDRSLNRSSGYFSSDEPRSQGHTTNNSSDEQSMSINQNLSSKHYKSHEQIPNRNLSCYHFDQINNIVRNYSQPLNNFNEAIDQIDALYNNLDVQTNTPQRTYDFSKLNRRKQLTQNPNEYSNRYTSTGFQQIPYQQQTPTDNNQNWTSLTNLVTTTPIRPSQSLSSSGILDDYGSPSSTYGSTQNIIVQQNRLNGQSQIVQRNRTSVKQIKQKNAAKRRNGNIHGQYSDEDDDDDDENDSPFLDNGRSQPSPHSYNFNNNHH